MTRGITIAGGGLAGLSLGIGLLRRGIPVELHEAGSYPRHRVCGEFICGVSPATLESLGIHESLAGSRRLSSAAWFRRGERLLEAPLERPAWGISRYELDNRLRRQFQKAGGDLRERSRLKNESREGLVWSAGRRPERGNWLGLKCHVRGLALDHDLEMHLGRGGYAGLSRIEDGRVNVCGLFRKRAGLEGRGSELLLAYLRAGGLEILAGKIRGCIRDEDSFLGIAGFRLGYQRKPSRALCLGDAGAMIPPFTGNGMSMAFESAALALEPLTDYARGTVDWARAANQIRAKCSRHFSRRLRLAGILHPFLTGEPAQSVTAFIARRGLLPYQWCFHSLR